MIEIVVLRNLMINLRFHSSMGANLTIFLNNQENLEKNHNLNAKKRGNNYIKIVTSCNSHPH